MYQLLVSDEAILDIADAIFWYNSHKQDLGFSFQKELKVHTNLLKQHPEAFQCRY